MEWLHKVEERLVYLHSIKSPLVKSNKEWKIKYRGWRVKDRSKTKSDYKTNTIFSIINAKKAEILSWLQEYDFIPLDDEGIRNTNFVKKIWEFEWLNSKTDKQIASAIDSSLISWDWFIYEWLRRITKNIKNPILDSSTWEIKWEDKEELVYDWIYCEYIPWENVYFDWTSLDDANEAIWIKDWDREDFIKTFELNKNYKSVNSKLPIGRHYYITTDSRISTTPDLKSDDIITELRYYNKSKDQLIILANWVEVYNSHIPYKHKELPFCKFEDYKLLDRFYSVGEYELLEEDEEYKDALRSLNIDVIKAQMWFTVIDPDADFDEATVEIGTNKFARVRPQDISHFSPNINASTIIQAETSADNDLIIKSWIDYRSQILWASETATKTSAKTQSARKRINLNLKLNWYSFFERLARLRMSNLSLLYSVEKKIPLKGWEIDWNWVYSPLNWWYWTFVVKPEYIKWSFNLIPITESILWISNERNKQNFLWFMQIAWNLVWSDGKPVFPATKLAEELARQWWVDYEKLTEQSASFKSPEDLLREANNRYAWVTNDSASPSSPDYIPPEQRSWSKQLVPTIGSLSWITE